MKQLPPPLLQQFQHYSICTQLTKTPQHFNKNFPSNVIFKSINLRNKQTSFIRQFHPTLMKIKPDHTKFYLYQLMHLLLSTLKSLKTLLLKIIIILRVSIFQDHHQGFFHSLPRWAASIQWLKCLNIYKDGNVDKNRSIVMWQHMFVFLWCVLRWGVSFEICRIVFNKSVLSDFSIT